MLVLEENEIWEFVYQTLKPPTDATSLAEQSQKDRSRWGEGPCCSSLVWKEDRQGDVGSSDKIVSE